jgi:hypothetical protein
LRKEVEQDAELRRMAKEATPWVGYRCGDKPLKHRCVHPKDAKSGNLVLLDVRNAGNTKDVLLGDWEGYYQLGVVSTRQAIDTIVSDFSDKSLTTSKTGEMKKLTKGTPEGHQSKEKSKDFLLHLITWEPYFKDKDGMYRPLWVENALRAKDGHELHPSKWQDVVSLPWCPIKQMPLEHSRKLLNIPDFNPPKRELAANYLNSGVDCHKQPKGYRHTQSAGTVRHVFQFDTHERRKNIISFNTMSQREILVEMSRTQGHDNVDYIYNS